MTALSSSSTQTCLATERLVKVGRPITRHRRRVSFLPAEYAAWQTLPCRQTGRPLRGAGSRAAGGERAPYHRHRDTPPPPPPPPPLLHTGAGELQQDCADLDRQSLHGKVNIRMSARDAFGVDMPTNFIHRPNQFSTIGRRKVNMGKANISMPIIGSCHCRQLRMSDLEMYDATTPVRTIGCLGLLVQWPREIFYHAKYPTTRNIHRRKISHYAKFTAKQNISRRKISHRYQSSPAEEPTGLFSRPPSNVYRVHMIPADGLFTGAAHSAQPLCLAHTRRGGRAG